jgi:hypothetical protein
VGGSDGVNCTGCHELAKPGVTEAAGRFFDGLAGLAGMGAGFGLGVDAGGVKGEIQGGGEIGAEQLIPVGVGTAEAVMEVGGMEDDAKIGGAGSEGAGEGDGVGSARKADRQTQTGLDRAGVEWKRLG